MKLNCDMGEGYGAWIMGRDSEIMPYIDMSNIACGFHASDPDIMNNTIKLAIEQDVKVGAHPGYPDLHGFGRKDMSFSSDELVNMTLYQVGALQALCVANNTSVSYIKPHGALYNLMMRDMEVYKSMLTAVSKLNFKVPLMIMAVPNHLEYTSLAKDFGVELLMEAFCDRAYTDDGKLQSRQISGAVYDDIDSIINQATQLIKNKSVTSCTGKKLSIEADSICIHGDGKLAVAAVQGIRKVLQSL